MRARVLFSPVPPPGATESGPDSGALQLLAFGEGETSLSAAPTAARLVFFARFVSNARKPTGAFTQIAQLDGSAQLNDANEPSFSSDAELTTDSAAASTDDNAADTTGDDSAPPMSVGLAGVAPSVNLTGNPLLLSLGAPPSDARFVEVGVVLEVNGQAEAPMGVNDVLDIPIASARPFIAFPTSRRDGPAAGGAPATGAAPAGGAPAAGGAAPAPSPPASPPAAGGSGPGAPGAAPPPAAPPTPGAITSNRVIVVKKPHTNPARQPVQLRVVGSFTGTGTLTRTGTNIKLFTALTAGTELLFDGTDNVFSQAQLIAGVTLFAESDTASAALNDFTLTLTLSPGAVKTVATLTAVELTLDIFTSRTAPGAEPAVLSATDKINVGRTVHLQDSGNHHGRALIVVRQAKPAAFVGNLRLAPRDTGVRIFGASDEVAAASQTVVATRASPHTFAANTVAAPPAAPAAPGLVGLQFWVEGISASAALLGTGVQLGIDGVEPEADRVALTVARLRRLEAIVASTRPRTARMGNGAAAHTLRRGTTATLDPTNYDVDFTSNPPLVLFRNSVSAAAPIRLGVQVQPVGLPVRWSIQRDTRPAPDGDAPAVVALSPNALPTLTPDPADPLKATLQGDAVGSFHIRPFIDVNGSGLFEGNDAAAARIDREPFIILNLVLVDAALVVDNSVARSANMVATAAAGGIRVQGGSFDINNPAAASVHMNVTADVVGGGGDGRRGLAESFAGWCNNESANEDIAGTYTDSTAAPPVNHREFSVFASNAGSATGPNFTFLTANPAPALVAPPLLDTGRPGAGTGGDSATLSRSRIRSRANQAVGQGWLVEAVDSPSDQADPTHAAFPAAQLVRFRFRLDFHAALCFWTNRTRASGPTGAIGDRIYTVLREFDWKMRGEWTIAAGALTVITAPNVAISGATTHAPIVAANATAIEVRAPTGLTLLAKDARA